jgi:hypothetical protein
VTAVRAALLILLLLAARAPARAGDGPATTPPTGQFGLPVGDGTVLWFHPGASAPPDGPGEAFSYEPGEPRTFAGRPVDVLRYVPRTADGALGTSPGYGQADFVDPATGEVVGGLDGWGREGFPEEASPRAIPCPGR